MAEDLQEFLGALGLSVKIDAVKGRCLVANRSFAPGEVIFQQEPYVCVLDANAERCDGCFMSYTNLRRCSACKLVRYCSSKCQKAEWSSTHREECSVYCRLKRENTPVPPPSLQMAVRLLLKRKRQSSGDYPTTAADNYDTVEALPTHYTDMPEERLVLYAQMASLVKSIVSKEDVLVKEITQNICRFSCNAHTICDDELRPLGTGLFPVVSIINHSCCPNSVLLFEGRNATVRALETIHSGTEVTVSYVELGENMLSRRKTLKEGYFFTCNCPRCLKAESGRDEVDAILEGICCPNGACKDRLLDKHQKQWKCRSCGYVQHPEKVEDVFAQVSDLVTKATGFELAGNYTLARGRLEQAEKLQTTLWHPRSVHLMRTRDRLLKMNLNLEDWDEALKYCQLTIPAYETAYPANHPLLGLQYYMLGKLEQHRGHAVEAVKALRKAESILSITHGSDGTLVRELSAMLREGETHLRFGALFTCWSLPK